MNLLHWSKDKEKIVDKIKSNTSFFKILLKTYNDSIFLERWIKHHANIVGLENLIIADNGSSDEKVLSIYKKYGQELLVFQFDGHHNAIHSRIAYKPLYEALQASSTFHQFIDTDEYLVWIDGEHWSADSSIVEHLRPIGNGTAVPVIWLFNEKYSDTDFKVNTTVLASGLASGKTIVPSKVPINIGHGLIHNQQFAKVPFWDTKIQTRYFLLHLNNFSKEQRIKSNINKLIKGGYCKETDDIHTILGKGYVVTHRNLNKYIDEIKAFLSEPDETKSTLEEKALSPRCLRLLRDGGLQFSSSKRKNDLISFFGSFQERIYEMLYLPCKRSNTLLNEISQLMEQKKPEAEHLLLMANGFYFNILDELGEPVFRKMLVRFYLGKGEFKKALAHVPKANEIGAGNWHEPLFEHAYAQFGYPEKGV